MGRNGNPRPTPVLNVFRGAVVPAYILQPLGGTNQKACQIDPRYRDIARRGAPEKSNLPQGGYHDSTEKVWWSRPRNETPIGDRRRGGEPGFMPPARPVNPNTIFASNDARRIVRFLDVSQYTPETPLPEYSTEDTNFPVIGFFGRAFNAKR